MGLQIRVRHALGERVIELPDRTVDQPLVVGRASTAEIQVPSVTVAPKHCVLFIHEGHWAVQDLGAGSGTFVNQEPVNGARFLQIGDVISVGGDGNAPQIEVDPAAAAEGRTGFAGTGMPQVAAAPYGAYAVPAATMAPMSQPAYGYAAPQAVLHQTQYAAPAPVMPVAEAPAEEFPMYTSVGYSSARRRKKSNSGPIAIVLVGTLLLAGGVIAFAVYNNKHNEQVLAQNEAVKKKAAADKAAAEKALRDAEEAAQKKQLFVDSGEPIRMPRTPRTNVATPSTPSTPPSTPAVATNNPPSTPATPPVTTTNPPATPAATPNKAPGGEEGMDPIKKPSTPASSGGTEEGMDPIKKPTKPAGSGGEEGMDPIKKPNTPPAAPKKDPETLDPQAAASWEAMKELSEQGGKESYAVLRFEDYKRMSPGTHDAEIDQFIDKKMDRIWWERIAQLLKKIDKLDVDSTKIRSELPDENNPDEKKKKIDTFKKMESEKQQLVKTLRDQMKYSGDAVPDLTSETSLAPLIGQRDKGAYEAWKKGTIGYIKANQGRLPWVNDL